MNRTVIYDKSVDRSQNFYKSIIPFVRREMIYCNTNYIVSFIEEVCLNFNLKPSYQIGYYNLTPKKNQVVLHYLLQ